MWQNNYKLWVERDWKIEFKKIIKTENKAMQKCYY